MAKATKKSSSKKSTSKRTLLAPKGDKRFVKRNEKGQITESDDVGRSLSQDKKRSATKKVKSGYGDKGDQARKSTAKKSSSKKSSTKK